MTKIVNLHKNDDAVVDSCVVEKIEEYCEDNAVNLLLRTFEDGESLGVDDAPAFTLLAIANKDVPTIKDALEFAKKGNATVGLRHIGGVAVSYFNDDGTEFEEIRFEHMPVIWLDNNGRLWITDNTKYDDGSIYSEDENIVEYI